jgi:hypothetical protein
VRFEKWIALAAAVLLCLPVAQAETHLSHPSYGRALAELRYARAHVSMHAPGVEPDADEVTAIAQIDKAMQDVKDASEDDHKSLSDHPLVLASWGRHERLRRALGLLDQARDNIELRQQGAYWKGLKANSAQEHVAKARQAIVRAMHASRHSSQTHQ